MSTKIEWACNPDGSKGETWPVCTGCSATSEGCRNCYAARMAATRLKHHPRYAGLATIEDGKARWTGEVRLNHDVLEQPLRWKKPRMVFIASMGDLFHPSVPEEFIWRVIEIAYTAQQHTFQILTKQPERMLDALTRSAWWNNDAPDNIWLGVSVENQAAADERILLLLQTPAAVRFVSVEPMLGAVNLREWLHPKFNSQTGATRFERINWVICGSESGPSARPMDEAWVRDLRDQCQAAGVSFFYKQKLVNGHKVGMPVLDGRAWQEFPGRKG